MGLAAIRSVVGWDTMSTRLGRCLVVVLGGIATGCDGDPVGWSAAESVPAIASLIATAVAQAGPGLRPAHS